MLHRTIPIPAMLVASLVTSMALACCTAPGLRPTPLGATTAALGATPTAPPAVAAPPLAPGAEAPALVHAPRDPSRVQLVVLGDTGEPAPFQARLRAAIAREPAKDGVLVTGDLVYPEAPACLTGTPDDAARAIYDERIGAIVGGLGAPTWLMVGNHDVARDRGEPARPRCISAWVAQRPELGLVMPETVYTVDFGVAILAVVDTNALDERTAAVVRRAFDGHPGRKLLAGHHVLKSYHDKASQDVVRPWMKRYGITPDMYLNGHAHVQQLGVYDGVPALTSGTGATPRERPSCPPSCGPGQRFGSSAPGYALVSVGADALEVVFKDADGAELYRWRTGDQR